MRPFIILFGAKKKRVWHTPAPPAKPPPCQLEYLRAGKALGLSVVNAYKAISLADQGGGWLVGEGVWAS